LSRSIKITLFLQRKADTLQYETFPGILFCGSGNATESSRPSTHAFSSRSVVLARNFEFLDFSSLKIGQFRFPQIKPCKLGDYFISFDIVMDMEQGKPC